MDWFNFMWLVAFVFIFIGLNWLYSMIIKYIDDKPPGCQSLYDVLLRDHFRVTKITGWIYTFLAVISRFDSIAEILRENPDLSLASCCLYSFGLTIGCVSLGSICVIRMLCLIDIHFMEESVGETGLRIGLSGITALAGISVCAILIVSGDVTTGTAFNLVTRQTVPVGALKASLHLSIYSFDVASFFMMQAFVEWKRWKHKQTILPQANDNPNTTHEKGIIQKSGLISLLITSAFLSLFLSNVLLTGKEMGQHFYVMEVFITSIVFFIVAPIVIILKNENMTKFVQHRLVNSAVMIGSLGSVQKSICNFLKQRNKVAAVVDPPHVEENAENVSKT